MKPRQIIALAAAAPALAVPLAAPSAADAAVCFKVLPGPGDAWTIKQNGSLQITNEVADGTNFDADHGTLTINGQPYPTIPNGESACTTTDTRISFPGRQVAGLTVSRTIESVDGRLRWLDTISNAGAATDVDVDFGIEVKPSNESIDSETGNASVTSADHWSVHKNDGGSFPLLQWGENSGAHDPTVISAGVQPEEWRVQQNGMPDATLRYESIPLGKNQKLRLLHTSGTSTSAASSAAAAKDRLTPFKGLTLVQARFVVNWGSDPDADGVSKEDDFCPGVKGDQADGCLSEKKPAEDEVPLPKPGGGFGPETGPAPLPPSSGPQEEAPAPAPAPAVVRSARDATAPVVKVSLRSVVKRRGLALNGLGPRVGCSEACAVTVKVKGRTRGKRAASTLLTKSFARTTATRTLRLKPGARKVRRLAAKRITVVVTATDAAGNRSTVSRVVRIR